MAEFRLVDLVGGFPPGLNTTVAPADLKGDESPDCYGLDLDKDGRLARGTTMPSGTTRVAKTYTVSAATWYEHYQRLWRASGTNLLFGARFYTDAVVPQAFGKITFTEDANSILGFIPFGRDSLFVLKTTGAYVISNITDTRGFWSRTDLMQGLGAAALNQATELDSTIYVSNANGLYAMAPNGQVTEVTRKVRNDSSFSTVFASKALTVDYSDRRIIGGSGGTGFIYEVETDKIFRWSPRPSSTPRPSFTRRVGSR